MKTIDFLPEPIRFFRERRKRIKRQLSLMGALFAAMMLLGFVRNSRIEQAHAELVMLNVRTANVERQLECRKELERIQGELMVMQRIEKDLGSRSNALDVMSELQRVTPPTILLQKLEMETVSVNIPIVAANTNSIAQVAPANNVPRYRVVKRLKLVITGLSPTDVDVANFIGQISASPFFEDVNMGYTMNVEFHDRKAREFQASCLVAR